MLSEPIFHRDSKGKVRSWRYEVDGPRWRTISGLVDGEKVITGWTVSIAKSQDTDEAQAMFEARAEEQKKLDRKYARSLGDIDEVKAAGVKPMLAHKYERWVGPCFSQPKLDGIRNLAARSGLWSRTGQPIVSCPHILEALQPFFDEFPDAVLDGELYSHELREDFNEITSLVKRTKPTSEDLAESARVIQYHVYDFASHDGLFGERDEALAALLPEHKSIVKVQTLPIDHPSMLDKIYGIYLEAGYEGQIVRLNGPYEQKRSKQLLKRKEFQDDEFPVVGIEEGNGNWFGYAKRAILRLPDGREFGAGIKGDQTYCAKLLLQKWDTATVRYFTPTPDGVPRFPVAVAFHQGERL